MTSKICKCGQEEKLNKRAKIEVEKAKELNMKSKELLNRTEGLFD